MNGFLRGITGLCLLRMVLDAALPEGECAAWADLGVELALLLCMLRGIGALFRWFP